MKRAYPMLTCHTVKGATVPGVPQTSDDNPFAPRRSAPLDIKMPAFEEAEQEAPAVVSFWLEFRTAW